MVEWGREKKSIIRIEAIALCIIISIAFIGIVCDVLVNKGIVIHEVENIAGVSLVLLQMQATVTTLAITIITFLSGNISDSYMGISISKFFLEIKPFFLKQKFIVSFEFTLIVLGVIAHLYRCYNIVFVIAFISLFLILISTLKVYEVFKGRKDTCTQIERYVEYVFITSREYISYGEAFLSDWKHVVLEQSNEEFEHYEKLFSMLTVRMIDKEKDIDQVNSLSEKMARFLLEHSAQNCRIKGIKFVYDFYENIWKLISSKEDKTFSLDKPISLISRISREWDSAFNSIDAETIQEEFDIGDFSELVIRVSVCTDLSNDNKNYEVSTINNLLRYLGGYISRQIKKGNLVDNKYWERIISDNYGYYASGIPEQAESNYLDAMAKRDFNICNGYLLSGQIELVKNAVFLDGIGNLYRVYSKEYVFKIFLIHCFMYYLAFRETKECIEVELQDRIKKVLVSSEVVHTVQHFIYVLSESAGILEEELEVHLEDTLEHYELFPFHSNGKTVIIDGAARDYFLCIVLLIGIYSFNRNNASELLSTQKYSSYLYEKSFKKLKSKIKDMYCIFEENENFAQQIDDMVLLFTNIMVPKYKRSLIEAAASDQREYEKNDVQGIVENKIRLEFQSKFNEIYKNIKLRKRKEKRYNKVCVLEVLDYTRFLEDKRRDTFADYAIGNFTSWLIEILKSDFGFKVINRNKLFRSDQEFRSYLINNSYTEFLGSSFAFGCTDYSKYDIHAEFLNAQTCNFVKLCRKSVALKSNVLSIKLNNVLIDVISPELCEVILDKNEKTGDYVYPSLEGVSLDYKEKEIRELLHDERKMIRINIDVTVEVKNLNTNRGVIVDRDFSV